MVWDLGLILTIAFYIYMTVVLIFIIMENRDAQSTFSWILVFILLPGIGLLLYVLFGRNWRVHTKKKKAFVKEIKKEEEESLKLLHKQEDNIIENLKNNAMSDNKRLVDLLGGFEESVFTKNNKVEILQNGSVKFPRLKDDLRQAKKFIHMQYFIWRDDVLTQEIKDILIEKAKSGVEVRLMFDPAGSILFMFKGRKYRQELKKVGIKMVPFYNSMARSKITTLNNINHQKIAIIDGIVGYTGGMNMGQEYIDGQPMYDSWRDTHLRVEGDAVHALQALFANSWKSITKESLFKKEYFFTSRDNKISNDLAIQIMASGPESSNSTIRQLFFSMITAANEKVYIQSPYFVPDATIFEALKLSAISGVDTRVMITGVPDKKTPYWAAFSFFEELLLAGVKIYHYEAGFIHSKTISVDDKFCTIGTTNLDLRSFTTSHEDTAVIFDKKITQQLRQDFINDLDKCKEFTLEDYNKLSKLVKFRNSVCRLTAPLL
jgi:cardiolipin synthase